MNRIAKLVLLFLFILTALFCMVIVFKPALIWTLCFFIYSIFRLRWIYLVFLFSLIIVLVLVIVKFLNNSTDKKRNVCNSNFENTDLKYNVEYEKTKTKRLNYAVSVTFIICVIIIIVSMATYKIQHKFSVKRWISYPEERVKIVDDLLSKHNLINKSKEEVIDLLGYETKSAYFKEDDNFVYYLGAERGFISIDSEWLVITFDDDIVIDVSIMRD